MFAKSSVIAAAGMLLTYAAPDVLAQGALPQEIRTIASADAAAPVERAIDIASAGTYEITLTDLGAATAPLTSVHLAVTLGSEIIGTPMSAPGVASFTAATAGSYVIRVTGKPGAAFGSGLFRVQVRNVGSGAAVDAFVNVLALPPSEPTSGQFLLEAPFTVAASGNHVVTLRDLQWPQAMNALLLAVVEEGGPLVASLATDFANPVRTATVALDSTLQYRVFAVAVTPGPTAGGIYSFVVQPSAGGMPALSRTIPVAGTALLGTINLAAGAHVLTLTDLAFPAVLAQRAALVVRSGQSAAATTTSGDSPFTAVAGPHDVFVIGTPGTTAGGGSLSVQIAAQGQAASFSGARAFALPSSGLTAFTYDAGVTAGLFRARLADYQFPAGFTSLRLAVAQGVAVLGTPLTTPGTVDVTTTAGAAHLLAFAQPTAQGGLFGADLMPVAAGTGGFETTQGVGAVFSARKISITGTARHDVRVVDVGFPANFANLAVAVTRGADRVGLIYGSGTFDFAATPGNYFVNFLAQPSVTGANAADKAGTYAISVTEKPPAPAITLTATPTRIGSGGTVSLTWTSQLATSCIASGGWTGTRATGGAETSPAVTADTTFTLTCSGAGGNTVQSVDVRLATPDSSGGSNGGGALGWTSLLALIVTLARRLSRRARVVPLAA